MHTSPRAGRVQAAASARKAGAKRRAWTRPSTATELEGVEGKSYDRAAFCIRVIREIRVCS